MSGLVLAIDQGTTSTRAIVFDDKMRAVGTGQEEFPQHFPRSGWVEHDPEEIWRCTVAMVRKTLDKAGIDARSLARHRHHHHRETVMLWDKETGKPVHNAIVWQDRRTGELCGKR